MKIFIVTINRSKFNLVHSRGGMQFILNFCKNEYFPRRKKRDMLKLLCIIFLGKIIQHKLVT